MCHTHGICIIYLKLKFIYTRSILKFCPIFSEKSEDIPAGIKKKLFDLFTIKPEGVSRRYVTIYYYLDVVLWTNVCVFVAQTPYIPTCFLPRLVRSWWKNECVAIGLIYIPLKVQIVLVHCLYKISKIQGWYSRKGLARF